MLAASGPPDLLKSPEWTQLAAGALRAGLQAACAALPAEPGGLLPGLVLGDTSDLDPALEEDFRTTGLTHLVAVSGANVAIVLGVVLLAARWLRVGPWPGAVLAALALVGFVILVRPSPSVLRAAAMGAIGLLALATGRTRAAAAALAAAVVLALLLDPGLASSVGFSLSVLATAALILLAPRWRDSLRAAGVPPGVAEALAVPAAAQVACAPVIAALSGQVSSIAVPANLLAAPAVAPATVLGVGSAVVSPFLAGRGGLLAWLASWPARWLVWIAHTGAWVVGSIRGRRGGPVRSARGGTWGGLCRGEHSVLRWCCRCDARGGGGCGADQVVAEPGPPCGSGGGCCDVGQGDAIVLPAVTVPLSSLTPGPIRCR